MLTQQENERLTRVGPGTPMGELLRRYWHPVGCSNLVTKKPQRVKVLGEELVLYRGESGDPVLMELRCLHRNVALDYGRVEGDSIRCPYHGWLYNEVGQCVAQPTEAKPSSSMEKIRLKSYRTEEAGGLIFAYMGPQPAPVLPLYDLLRATQGEKQIGISLTAANWLQAVENIVDTTHFSWLHGYTFPFYGARRTTARFEPKSYGIDIHLGVEGDGRPEDVAPFAFPCINRFALPGFAPGAPMMQVLLYRVPVDDVSHENYFVAFTPNDDPEKHTVRGMRMEQKKGEYRALPNDWWGIDIGDQDRMAMEQQGPISDRTREHLVASDAGIALLRRMLREALDAVEAGNDPVGVIRDPAKQIVEFEDLAMQGTVNDQNYDANYAVGVVESALADH